MPTYWHNRIGIPLPADAPGPAAQHATLYPLIPLLLGAE